MSAELLAAGDRLVAPLNLTSARWQVLGAIANADRPMPVAWLARELGQHRQGVRRIVNDLAREGFTAFAANPHHRRANLVVLTPHGRAAFADAMRRHKPWIENLTTGLAAGELETALGVAKALRERLRSSETSHGPADD